MATDRMTMGTLTIKGWDEHPGDWDDADSHANAELSKRLRSGFAGSPAARKQLERDIRARKTMVITTIRPEHLESVRQVLETMGADVVLSFSDESFDD
jgi:hypothetical protein